MKVFEGRSRLIIPALTILLLVALAVATIVFLATRKPEGPAVEPRFVQSTIMVSNQETYEKAVEEFNSSRYEAYKRGDVGDWGLIPGAKNPYKTFGPRQYFGPLPKQAEAPKSPEPKKQTYDWAAPVLGPKGTGKVVIIIDDMGVDRRSAEVIAIKEPLTLAFLPYARNLQAQTLKAKSNGHELMIHVPMQPESRTENPGPDVLTTDMTEEQVDAVLEKAFNSFSGYVGINNHMGSRMTADGQRMAWVMEELQKRKLFFVDSMTSAKSMGWRKAQEYGLAYAKRDVFLDDATDMASVQASLRQLERAAYKNGVAIAIGHPKENTIAALKAWLPTLKDKGLTLVPVSQVLHRPQVKSVFATPVPFGPHLPPRE